MFRGPYRLVLIWLAALSCMFCGAPAMASDLFSQSCVLPAEKMQTLQQAEAASGWVCNPAKRDAKPNHTWLRIPVSGNHDGRTRLVGDAMAMDGIFIARILDDGSRETEYFDSRRIARHWTTGTRFALPVDLEGVERVYLRFDRPLGADAASSISWVPQARVEWERWVSLVILGVIIGMLILNVIISGFIALAIRRKFAWYHCAFSSLLIVYVTTSGSLAFLVFPEMSLWTRSVLSYASIAWAIALLGPFLIDFFEKDLFTDRMRQAAAACAWLAFIAAFLLPVGALLDVSLRTFYHLAFLPGAALTVIATVIGLRRGSLAARAFAIAWAAPMVFALERVFRNLGFYRLPPIADFAFYGALAAEAAVLTLAIGWQVSRMRKERDRALAEQSLLKMEARRDALTGLPNRRDYDRRVWREGETLALMDLDHFKAVNDHYGHATGDAVLKTIGKVLAQAVSEGTINGAWRMGGEEFAVAIHAGGARKSAVAINAVRARIPYAVDAELAGLDIVVTASAGLADMNPDDIAASYGEADRMLYSAKMAGRDRLCFEDRDTTLETRDGSKATAVQPPSDAEAENEAA